MNMFEKDLCEKLGKEKFEKIQRTSIGIAGCGGLGSNCAVNLVRSGFKHFVLVDLDKVEHGNLNRQFYFADQVGKNKSEALKENLLKINPEIEIMSLVNKLDEKNISLTFSSCQIIVEAFDEAKTKAMLANAFMDTDMFVVSGSGMAGIGNSDDIKINKIKDNFYIVGDLNSDIKDAPPFSPRVNIVAAKQSDLILEHTLNS